MSSFIGPFSSTSRINLPASVCSWRYVSCRPAWPLSSLLVVSPHFLRAGACAKNVRIYSGQTHIPTSWSSKYYCTSHKQRLAYCHGPQTSPSLSLHYYYYCLYVVLQYYIQWFSRLQIYCYYIQVVGYSGLIDRQF